MMLIVRYILFLGFLRSQNAVRGGWKSWRQENNYDDGSNAGKAGVYLHPLISRAKIAGDSIRGDIV